MCFSTIKSRPMQSQLLMKIRNIKQILFVKNCSKNVTDLEKHYDESLICKQIAGFKTCKVNLPRILISETNYNQKVNVFCPNCSTSVKSLEHHFNVSLICKQTKLIQDNQKSETKPENNPVTDNKKIYKFPLKSKLSLKR